MRKSLNLIIYFISWFVVFSLPFIFLPLHKFTYYLTLPLIGVVAVVALIIESGTKSSLVKIVIVFLWILMSMVTLDLTYETHWITRGSATARKIHDYFVANDIEGKVVFYNTQKDDQLPWSPSEVIKNTLSDEDYFLVFMPGVTSVEYKEEVTSREDQVKYIESRQFIGY